jgi:hypothetical protein
MLPKSSCLLVKNQLNVFPAIQIVTLFLRREEKQSLSIYGSYSSVDLITEQQMIL